MCYLRWFCLVVGLSLLSPPAVFGQPTDDSTTDINVWIHGGPAATALGLGTIGGAAVEFDRHVFSLRAVSTDQAFGDELWEIAVLYGRATATEQVFLSAGVGTAVVGGTRYPGFFGGGRGEDFDPMIGFPLEGQIAWTPVRAVALGVYAFANVNTAHPVGGVGLTLRLGDVR